MNHSEVSGGNVEINFKIILLIGTERLTLRFFSVSEVLYNAKVPLLQIIFAKQREEQSNSREKVGDRSEDQDVPCR